jgi:nucleotide-binding universal stress UspA family protein
VVPPRAADTFDGTNLLCAIRDRRDLPAAATAACWARDLRLQLVLASVIGPPRLPLVAGIAAVPPPPAMRARETVSAAEHELAEVAAAVEAITPCRVLAGSTTHSPGRTLRRISAEQDTALVVVGPSRRSVLLAAATGSPTRSLLRAGTRPVMVCPRPEPALAIRAAATPPDHRFRAGSRAR